MTHFGRAQEAPELRKSPIKPVYIMCEEGLLDFQIQAVLQAIYAVLRIAMVSEKIQVVNFGVWRQNGWRNSQGLEPYYSIDWYIQSAIRASTRQGKLNGNQMIIDIWCEPWQKLQPHYDIVILRSDMYSGEINNNFVIGLASKGHGTVISINRFLGLDPRTQIDCIQTETMHEVGHVFGLIPEQRQECVEESLGKHCTNICVMRQGTCVPGDWIRITRDRLEGHVFCPTCQCDLRKYFIY